MRFHAKVGTKNIFKPSTGNKSIHHDSNDKGVRIVYFDIDHYLVVAKIGKDWQ